MTADGTCDEGIHMEGLAERLRVMDEANEEYVVEAGGGGRGG